MRVAATRSWSGSRHSRRLEPWLTWPVAGLAFLMFCLAVYLYDTVGGQVLDTIGLHFGRFGSLGVVILLTVVLVAACLGLVHLLRGLRGRARPGRACRSVRD